MPNGIHHDHQFRSFYKVTKLAGSSNRSRSGARTKEQVQGDQEEQVQCGLEYSYSSPATYLKR